MSRLQRAEWDSGVDSPPRERLRSSPSWDQRTHPQEVISWALTRYGSLAMTSGFNLNGIVLIDMAVAVGYGGEVLFVDTGYHFGTTLELRGTLAARYPGLDFVTLSADRPDDRMFTRDPDRCCALRKVTPLVQYLRGRQPEALLSGRSREQNGLKERSRIRRDGAGTGPSQSPDPLGPRRPRSLCGGSRTAPQPPLLGGIPEHRLRPLHPRGPGR